MPVNGFRKCEHYIAFPEHRGEANGRLDDLEGRMLAKTTADAARDKNIRELKYEAFKSGWWRALALVIMIPVFNQLLRWFAEMAKHAGP